MKAFRKKQKDEAQLAMAKRGRAERKKEKSSIHLCGTSANG